MNNTQLSKVLEQISLGELSREKAAKLLGISTRTVNRQMKLASIKRPEADYVKRRKIAQVRRELKDSLRDKAKGLTIEILMKKAGISRRTAYRWKNEQ